MPTYWRRLLTSADLEALRVVADGKASPESCPLCREVPDDSSVVEKGGRPADSFREHLVGDGSVKRCPTSGAMYFEKLEEYEYLAGGSEDTYSYQRISPDRAGRMLAEWASEGAPKGTA